MKIRPVDNPNILPKSVDKQLKKIYGEVYEAIEAFYGGDIVHTDEEVMDIIVACRTYYHLRGMSDAMVDNIYKKVEEKNRKRNYYLGDEPNSRILAKEK